MAKFTGRKVRPKGYFFVFDEIRVERLRYLWVLDALACLYEMVSEQDGKVVVFERSLVGVFHGLQVVLEFGLCWRQNQIRLFGKLNRLLLLLLRGLQVWLERWGRNRNLFWFYLNVQVLVFAVIDSLFRLLLRLIFGGKVESTRSFSMLRCLAVAG